MGSLRFGFVMWEYMRLPFVSKAQLLSYFLVSSCLLVLYLGGSFPVFLIFHVALGQLSFFISQGVMHLNISNMLRLVMIGSMCFIALLDKSNIFKDLKREFM